MGFFTDEYGDISFGKVGTALVLGLTLTIGYCGKSCNEKEYSHGVRVGVINKFANKGFFWKTYEGQMALEGIVSTGESTGANVWDFSLDAQARHGEKVADLAKQLDNYAQSSTKVRVTYREPWKAWPWRSETDYLVQKVEPAPPKPKQ